MQVLQKTWCIYNIIFVYIIHLQYDIYIYILYLLYVYVYIYIHIIYTHYIYALYIASVQIKVDLKPWSNMSVFFRFGSRERFWSHGRSGS